MKEPSAMTNMLYNIVIFYYYSFESRVIDLMFDDHEFIKLEYPWVDLVGWI